MVIEPKHFEAIRWRNGEFCPYCNSDKVYHFSDQKTHKCGACRKRFSIKVGTTFEDSKIPLQKWFMAIWLITSHKKGIGSTQLAKDISVTQKTAWFMLHRLRHAAQTGHSTAHWTGRLKRTRVLSAAKKKQTLQQKTTCRTWSRRKNPGSWCEETRW